jgi:hypothetical protein
MVGEQRWQVVRSGTPRVQGYPTPHKRHGRRRGQAVKAGHGPPRLRGAQRPLLTGTAAAPSPPKRDGVRAPRSCRLLGLRGDAPASRDLRRHRHHAGQRHNAPAPGWREPPRGADGPPTGAAWTRQRQALLGWAGANTTDCAQRLTRTPVVTAPAVTTHTNGCWACGLLLRLAEQQATRAGQVGARHNGGRVQRGHKQSFSGSLGTRYMRQPVMLSWPSANLPRRPARLGTARRRPRPAILFCAARAWL